MNHMNIRPGGIKWKVLFEYRISNKEPQNFEGNPSTLDIIDSIFCGSIKIPDFPQLLREIRDLRVKPLRFAGLIRPGRPFAAQRFTFVSRFLI
jgi:hypothetical protein